MSHGAYILGCSGKALTASEAAFFRESDPWGFIVFARNVETPEHLRRLTGDLRAAVGRDAPVLIDQEGGRVARMGPPYWRRWPAPLDQMRASDPDMAVRGMYLRYRLVAAELRDAGVDVNCAPLADVASGQTHPFLRNRCYGEDVGAVVAAARAVADGLLAGGVLPVLKHIPGHGRALVDSHLDLPRVDATRESLRDTDFAAFRDLADLPLGMTAHIVFEAIDPDRPATQSAAAMAVIRDEIGFDGLLMTDDIGMGALSGDVGSRSALSLEAGCDVILHCNGEMGEMVAVAEASGGMTPAAAARAQAALSCRAAPDDADPGALAAEYDAIVGDVAHV